MSKKHHKNPREWLIFNHAPSSNKMKSDKAMPLTSCIHLNLILCIQLKVIKYFQRYFLKESICLCPIKTYTTLLRKGKGLLPDFDRRVRLPYCLEIPLDLDHREVH
jgi:hypothetical protein